MTVATLTRSDESLTSPVRHHERPLDGLRQRLTLNRGSAP
jgi:hypothetical protein